MSTPSDFGVYVHAPWCRVRCPYCAFNVYPDREADWASWGRGVQAEWATERAWFPGRAHSLYFGGGTPSLAPPAELAAIRAAIPLSAAAEVTAEVNPGTLDRDGLAALIDAGINRLSLGLQTFQPRLARLLNRGHTVRDADALVRAVAALPLRSWSVDLIFALPGQTLAELDADLDALLAHDPPHVALYGLTFEPGTPFARARDRGRLVELDDDAWRAQFDRVRERLAGAGLEGYEVSNHARPGHRSRHNEAVWRGGAYAGLGPGAHGLRPDGVRTENHGPVDAWLADLGGAPTRPSPREAAADLVLTALRHQDGLDPADLPRRFGHALAPAAVAALTRAGFLAARGGRLALSPAGVPVADGVVRHLCASLRPADRGPSPAGERVTGPRLDNGPPLA